jgi:hypothetical protein
MENIDHYVRPAVQQHDVTANEHVSAVRGRRWQTLFEVWRTGLDALLQPWRERAAPHELPFESRRQLVSFGKSRRQIVLVVVIPTPDVAIMISVVAGLLVVIAVFPVAFSVTVPVTVSVPLGQCKATCEPEQSCRAG